MFILFSKYLEGFHWPSYIAVNTGYISKQIVIETCRYVALVCCKSMYFTCFCFFDPWPQVRMGLMNFSAICSQQVSSYKVVTSSLKLSEKIYLFLAFMNFFSTTSQRMFVSQTPKADTVSKIHERILITVSKNHIHIFCLFC